jgi:predicted alpha-1,2-mannosidase
VNNSPEILPAGVYTWFDAPEQNNQILARVGVSFMSVEQACGHAEREIPDFDFNGTYGAAQNAWADKFSVLSVDPGAVNHSLQSTFWSGFYRAHISPQDYTGENYLWESNEPYYDSYYCMWDSYRVIHQAITLFDPWSQTQMIRTLLDVYRHEGKLPDCRMSLCKGFTQGGSSADIVLVDAFLKNITEGIDWQLAYEAIVSDAEEEPLNWAVEGRGGLLSWKSLNYIPADDFDPYGTGLFTRSASRTIEYAYNDFCIATMAKALGNQGDYEKYIERSTYWRNVWKDDQTSFLNETDSGFVGFLMPRYLNGTFGSQDTFTCSLLQNFTSCYLNPDGTEFYEGSSWLYSFLAAPGDMASLIAAMGGRNTFIKRLDYWHDTPELAYMGNEQPFQTVFQYHHAGRPGKSAERVHQYIPSQFNDSIPVGIPGNDDSGAMGSFVVLSMMGTYPNPGTDQYYLTPPFFPEVNLTNRMTGNMVTIRNINFDAEYTNIYIQSATLNGENYTKNYVTHNFFLEGGILELTLGANESSWGTRQEDCPPSLTTDNGIWD